MSRTTFSPVMGIALLALSPLTAFAQAPATPPAAPAPAISSGYADLITQAVGLIKQDKNTDAFTAAQKAVALTPERPEGYYYSGVALYRQDQSDGAVKMLNLAMDRVASTPDSQITEAVIKETLAHIAGKRDYAKHVAAGDQALVDGLKAKAADEYTQAWTLDSSHSDIGLKAAGLWSGLGEYVECARIVNALKDSSDADTKASAKQLYDVIKGNLPEAADKLVAKGIVAHLKGDDKAAVQEITDAVAALPSAFTCICLGSLYASLGDETTGVKQFKLAAKNGAHAEDFKSLFIDLFQPELRKRLFSDTKFLDFLTGAFGQSEIDTAKDPKNWDQSFNRYLIDDITNVIPFKNPFEGDRDDGFASLQRDADGGDEVPFILDLVHGARTEYSADGSYENIGSSVGKSGNMVMLKALEYTEPDVAFINFALGGAYNNGHKEAIEFLLPYVAKLNDPATVWHAAIYAIHKDDSEFLNDLLSRVLDKKKLTELLNDENAWVLSGNLELKDPKAQSALWVAVIENAPHCVDVLLQYGANTHTEIIDNGPDEDKTPLRYAEDHKFKEVADVLKKAHAPKSL